MWIGYPLWFTRSHQSFQIGHTHTLTEVNIGFIREKYQNYNTNTHVKLSWEAELHTFVSRKKWELKNTHSKINIIFCAERKNKRYQTYLIQNMISLICISDQLDSCCLVGCAQDSAGTPEEGMTHGVMGASSRQPPPSPPTFFRRMFWTFPKPSNLGAYYFGAIAFPQNAPYFYRRGFFLLSPSHFTIGWKYDTWSNLASGV